MKQTNASIFIPHLGCPHKCAFCDKDAITQKEKSVTCGNVTVNDVADILDSYVKTLQRRNLTAQVAFFGGTFTALEPDYRDGLLRIARGYIDEYPHLFTGIRCSTRPDYISADILEQLRFYGVTAVELGAQSMVDDVLVANERGHTSDDVRESAELIKRFGFELGLQMMTGLYKDTVEHSLYTADGLIKLNPDTARIYPTVIMGGTRLGELYQSGAYKTFGFDETVELCAEVYGRFTAAGVRVIRIGLNYSGDNCETGVSAGVQSNRRGIIGGNYSPVMGELCIGRHYFNKMRKAMEMSDATKFKVYTDKRNISKINGHKGENRLKLERLGFSYRIKEKPGADLEVEPCPVKTYKSESGD